MITMPWTHRTAPNLMLQVTDRCNVRCQACYSPTARGFRALSELAADLDAGSRLRRLHTVTLTGGEPTLHTEIGGIVRMVKQRRYHTFLLTNGMAMNDAMMADLRASGLDSILFHVDTGQRRADLPDPSSLDACLAKLGELVRLAERHGIDACQSWTIYPDADDRAGGDWRQVVRSFLHEPAMSFLFMAKAMDANVMAGHGTDRAAPHPFRKVSHPVAPNRTESRYRVDNSVVEVAADVMHRLPKPVTRGVL